MAVTAAELRVIVQAAVSDALRDLNRVDQAVDQSAQGQTRGARVSQAASRAIVGSAAAIGAGFAVAVQEGAEFSQGLADINTVARLTEGDTAALGDAIQQMSRDTGLTTEQLTAAMYDMVSAGTITSEQLSTDLAGSMETVNAAAMLAIGGMGDIAGTTDLMTSALNAYGMEADRAGEISDIFAVAIERGKVTADEIGASLANVAPIAADAGIEIEEISAAYATLTANGVPAAEATTQMRSAIVALLSPNEKLKDLMNDTGINFAQIAEEDGLHVALQQLRDVTDEVGAAFEEVSSSQSMGQFESALAANQEALGLTNSEMQKLVDIAGADGVSAAIGEMNMMVAAGDAGLSDVLGRVEAYNFTLQSTGENAVTFGENLSGAMDAAGTASEQAAIRMEGPVEVAKRLAANVMTFMEDVGGPAAQSLGPFLLMINQLGPAMMLPIRAATALGGAIGGIAGKGLARGIPMFGRFGLAIAKATVFMGGMVYALVVDGVRAIGKFALAMTRQAIAAVVSFGTRMAATAAAALASFASLIVSTVVPAIIGFAATIWTTVIPAIVALAAPFLPIILIVAAVVAAVAALWVAWENNFLGIRDIAETVWNAIVGFISGAIDFIVGLFTGFMEFIGGLWDGVTAAAETVWNIVSTIVGKYLEIITFPIRTFIGFIATIWDGFAEAAETVWGIVSGIVGGAVEGITGVIQSIVAVAQGVWDTVSGIFGAIGDAAQGVGDFVGGVGDSLFGWVPEFETGAWDTGPRAGLAMLHPHEMVVPRRQAEVIRTNRGGMGAGGGGGTTVVNNYYQAQVEGILPARSVRDVGRGLRELGENGKLVRRTVAKRAESYSA